MGLDWRQMVALLTGFVAKENAVATLGVLYGASEGSGAFSALMQNVFTPASGLAFLVFQMLFIPCVATVAAIRQETNSWRWTLLNIAVLAIISLAAGTLAYQVGRLWLL
jgi:ferrous iron transport protein B